MRAGAAFHYRRSPTRWRRGSSWPRRSGDGGNWFNQELFGGPSDLPWAVEIDRQFRPEFADVETFHPTFLYESLWCISVALVLIWADRRSPDGPWAGLRLYVALYTLGPGSSTCGSTRRGADPAQRLDVGAGPGGRRRHIVVSAAVAPAARRRRRPCSGCGGTAGHRRPTCARGRGRDVGRRARWSQTAVPTSCVPTLRAYPRLCSRASVPKRGVTRSRPQMGRQGRGVVKTSKRRRRCTRVGRSARRSSRRGRCLHHRCSS